MASKKASAMTAEDAFKSLDKALGKKEGAALAMSAGDLCKVYGKIKTPLTFLVPLIEKVPIWGKRVADAIRILMSIADTACPT